MLNFLQISNVSDLDETQYLNGKGSAVIILNKSQKTTNRYTLINNCKNNLLTYLIIIGLAASIMVVISIENEYQIATNKTLAENKQLREIIKQTEAKTSNNDQKQSETSNDKKEDNNPISENRLIAQQKQPPKSVVLPPQQPATTHSGEMPTSKITISQKIYAQRWLGLKDESIYQNSKLADQQRTYYQQKYNISSYDQLPICIVIPSYNNIQENRHIKNIKSIVMQEYTNYHIVFIDDASTDGTGDQIQSFLAGQNKIPKERYVVIKNKQQKRAMPNLRRAAIEFCQPEDIFIIVDGDDQLIGRQVFKLFNSVFQSKNAWFVYSNFLNDRGTIGYSRAFPENILKNNRFRAYPFITSHLRAFYTQLFINIKETDLKNDAGEYLKAANDVAICIPILQMSHQRVAFIQELTYLYNSNTGQNNHQVRLKQQKFNDRTLRTRRKKYTPLQQLQFPSKTNNVKEKTQRLLREQNSPTLFAELQSANKNK